MSRPSAGRSLARRRIKKRWFDSASHRPFLTGGVASFPDYSEQTFGRIAHQAFRESLPAAVWVTDVGKLVCRRC
jgi:hypothetical protein